ncbi:D-alanyl-D-alanine carboxypeptidase family protein [Lyngbya confervoides]|uniref:D-alanyl-D-alanine carboxypeptidase family protein n=1 Tax=Lyngbya confervoides BDU141951 TaxID=1574623 RepID=A0ABD4T9F6_9CYAN|nr:D-alanyl-D-alanine carboxypeptidase family protein [Lyngbya confervoides]MCM1985095.1 D-alanyl-D-alanine carboxypeptidase family protein [Lyngbya confervoides BDU141951]
MKAALKFIRVFLLSLVLVIGNPLLSAGLQKHGHYPFQESQSAQTSVGDYYGRTEYLTPDAAAAFRSMQSAAAQSGINLGVISGFRSRADQATLWQRQVSRQGSEQSAAHWSAPPGHSEHHTGYALDIRDLSQPQTDLKQSFESTRAYGWLRQNAGRYGFELSFPPGNAQGVSYEPWHWRYVGSPAAKSVFRQTVAAAAPQAVPDSAPAPTQPNLNDMSFGDFKLEESGAIAALPELSASLKEADATTRYEWVEGDSLANVLNLGDIGYLKPEDMTIEEVSKKTDIDLEQVALSNVQLLGLQTVGSLSEAIPGLPDMPVKAIQPIADLVERAGKSYVKAWLLKNADAPLAKLLKVDPLLKDKKLKDLALEQFGIGAIPGLKETPIGNFKDWQKAKIADIPGLEKLPISQFPLGMVLNPSSVVGIVDVVYGPNESTASYKPITGSEAEGFKVPCLQQNCAYLELRDPLGKDAPLHQARWIKGGQPEVGGQMVKGGSGLLGTAFGGKEPTGRMPFGPTSNMKVVLTDANESEGTAKLSIYLRVEKEPFGKTPFIFGPIPFMTVKEGDSIPVGIEGQSSFSEPNVEIPDSIRREIDQVNAQYGETASSDCTDAVMKQTDGSLTPFAQTYVPLLLKEAEKAKLSENQTAYVLATARHASGLGKYMEQLGDRQPWGNYYARGLVGLTDEANYQKWSDILGMDLLSNPDLVAQPEISVRILVEGMKRGAFTGYKLDDFINGSQVNFYDARSILNGVKEGAEQYANTASQYQRALKSCIGFAGSCDGTSKMAMPTQGSYTSGFGYRIHPVLGTYRFHSGDDIGAPTGTPIVAADCGKVVLAEWEGGYGNSVVIEHRNKLFTRYAHQSVMTVKVGQSVGRGQRIGSVGSTGRSTGPHLHFEVRKGGLYGEAQDPKKYL